MMVIQRGCILTWARLFFITPPLYHSRSSHKHTVSTILLQRKSVFSASCCLFIVKWMLSKAVYRSQALTHFFPIISMGITSKSAL